MVNQTIKSNAHLRQCVSCRAMKPKYEMIRVVRTPDNVVAVDYSGKLNGRGAYFCASCDCLRAALKKRKYVEQILKCQIPEALFDSMLAEVENSNV